MLQCTKPGNPDPDRPDGQRKYLMSHIYLDANSTTRLDAEVQATMLECYQAGFVNPASQHQPGQTARRHLELARTSIADALSASSRDRVLFTSGGTEANNLAIFGLAGGCTRRNSELPSAEVIISSIEHPSVLGAADFLATQGFIVHRLPVDHAGHALTESLEDLIGPQTQVVSLMLANNETGVIQDVAAAAEICRKHGVPLHCDAVQAIGKLPVDFGQMGVSALTLTAHKLHGPRGIGALVMAEDIEIQPMLFGGFQQLGQRPGTEDVALASGFAKAVELAVAALPQRSRQLGRLRDLFEASILAQLPETVINGAGRSRAPHTSNLSFPGYCSGDQTFATVNRQALLMAVDAAGVAISTGSACASGSSEPSHVLSAMCLPEEVVESSIRVSLDIHTTESDIVQGSGRIINAIKHLRQQKSRRK